MNGSSSTELAPTLSPRRSNINEKRVSFDIENDSDEGLNYPHTDYTDNKAALTSSKNPVVVADILKTLFFILVWYTFSTFLTLYNKTLLGDDMGKFPAPLLMNTIHFSMQAIFSNAVTYFWSKRFQPTVTMSWKDYFMRVVPTALGTALDINLSNASLVFITVTFATMCKSAAPIFLLIFAFAFRLESPSFKLLGIMLIISAGVLLTADMQILHIQVAVFYFHDEFTWLKGAGLVTIMFGVSLFNWYKYQKLHKEKLGVDELSGSQTTIPAKYVILEEVDDEETSP
ncbi:hypothetical protein CTI12_AA436900 [Artemisia annua]|uniref:Sugar phosphate transporter domain-containing protein n=1 Tax=Artemisia annua TaxID=35608 RepID=A0A2U1L4Z7_ARTAN|nr:hypothetical protein CTI12_AA436900 [Artemisia annua]